MNEKMRRLGEERSAIRELYEYGLRMKELGEENVFDFSLGSPSVPTSESVQREIGRLLKETPPEVLHGYTSAAGLYSAREAVARQLRKTYGAKISAKHVYLTCGAAASLTAAIHALAEAGDEFVVIDNFRNGREAEGVKKRIERELARFNGETKREYRISLSIGYALWSEVARERPEQLVDLADERMYEEKQKKKAAAERS